MKTIILSYILSFLIQSSGRISIAQDKKGLVDCCPFYIDIKKNLSNIKSVNMSSIGKNLQYIPLATTPDCMIPYIDKVEFSDSNIFVSDSKRLLQFDRKGKFIRQIGSLGRGPEEYLSVPDFCIDRESREIFIISTKGFLVFSFGGQFKKSFNLSVLPSQIIFKDKNCLMLHLFNLPGQPSESSFSWITTDRQGVILTKMKNNLKRVNKPGLIIVGTPLYSFNDKLHFMEAGIDTLYYFQEETKEPYSIFSFGNLKMDIDLLLTPATFKAAADKNKDKLWIESVVENNDYLFIKLSKGLYGSSVYVTYNKKTAGVFILKEDVFKNDIDGGAGFWPKRILNDTILIDYIDAFNLLKIIKKKQSEGSKEKANGISEQLATLGKKLTETSNPVLMILK